MRHTTSDETPLERVASLHNARLITPNEAWRSYSDKQPVPPELSTTYGDWSEVSANTPIDPSKVYIIPGYCGGSDYSGNLVEVSNHKAIIDMMPNEYQDGAEYLVFSGGFGTFDIAIRIDALTPDLLDAIEGLEDYPLLDEDLHSQLEMESQNEAWENDIRSDFKTALGKALYSTWEDSPVSEQRSDESDADYETRCNAVQEYLCDECAEMSDSDLSNLFWRMAELANEYWSNEEGSGSWIDAATVVTKSLTRKQDSDYARNAYAEVKSLIQSAMSDTKYDLGIMRYVNPNQLTLTFQESN
jgi:hypothetical protein